MSVLKIPPPSFVAHPTALIERGTRIGTGTRIWAFAHVLKGARIGKNCNIGDYVYVESGVRLGDGVTVKNGAQLWEGLSAENGVFIGPECTFTNHLLPRAFLKRPKSSWLKKTLLREGCTLGARATLLCGITIGRYAFVAAGALVTRSVPDFALVMGSPAAFHSWRCFCGFSLIFRGSRAYCKVCRERFRMDAKGTVLFSQRNPRDIQKILQKRFQRIDDA